MQVLVYKHVMHIDRLNLSYPTYVLTICVPEDM